jgi:hypothetical protein
LGWLPFPLIAKDACDTRHRERRRTGRHPVLLAGWRARGRVAAQLAAPYVLFLPFMQILRISGYFSTPFRLTVTLNLLVATCWIGGAWMSRKTRAPI